MSTAADADNPTASAPRLLRARVGKWLAAIALLVLAGAAAAGLGQPPVPTRELLFTRATGIIATVALLAALAVTPLGVVPAGQRTRLLGPILRRGLGMAAAWLALVHAGVAFVGPLRADPRALVQTSHLYAGMTALGVLIVLLLTSFAGVVRVLRLRFWKELHRLVYVAALLVVQHITLSAGAERELVIGVGSVVALLLLTRGALGAWSLRRR